MSQRRVRLFQALYNAVRKRRTAPINIVIRFIKSPGIPRVGNIPSAAGIIQQLMNLFVRISSENLMHIPYVRFIHSYEHIVFVIIALFQLHRAFISA